MELKYLYYTPLFFNGIIFDLTGGYSIIDKKKSKKLILIRSNVDFDNRLIPLLEQERLDFEIVVKMLNLECIQVGLKECSIRHIC